MWHSRDHAIVCWQPSYGSHQNSQKVHDTRSGWACPAPSLHHTGSLPVLTAFYPSWVPSLHRNHQSIFSEKARKEEG